MKLRFKHGKITMACIAAMVLIFDAQNALAGADEGIRLCIQTVIPSLFPFLVLSGYINGMLSGQNFKLLKPLGRLCGLPAGSESILLLGFLGGYPIGAQCIGTAYQGHILSKHDAERMLAFCSNAGPAFIFGMLSGLFASPLVPWLLWIIHIISALISGVLLPGKSKQICCGVQKNSITVNKALIQGIRAMATICGWVILFRVAIKILTVRTMYFIPSLPQTVMIGLTELTNGCLEAECLPETLRFVFCSVFLGFGGLCVVMQTASVAQGLNIRLYIIGKILQGAVSGILAVLLLPVLFPSSQLNPVLIVIFTIAFLAVTIFTRKNSSIFKKYSIQYRK